MVDFAAPYPPCVAWPSLEPELPLEMGGPDAFGLLPPPATKPYGAKILR